jgi:hypothetical protein
MVRQNQVLEDTEMVTRVDYLGEHSTDYSSPDHTIRPSKNTAPNASATAKMNASITETIDTKAINTPDLPRSRVR